MAVSEQTPYIEYTANGIAKSFALEFDCENQDHLIVLVDDVEPIVGTWSLSGGAVVFGTTPSNGKKITIQRNTPFRRDEDFQSYDNSFRPAPVNKGFDKTWWKIQELGVADWLLGLKIQKFRDDVNLTALENTLEEAKQIRDETADSVTEVQSNVEQSQTLLANTTAQSNLAQGYASSADSANTAAQQAAINVSDAESNVYSALNDQTTTVNTALSNLSTTANKYYSTLAAATADIANIALNQSVTIGEEANSGLWEKKTAGATSLTKSPYDPITLSKNYTDIAIIKDAPVVKNKTLLEFKNLKKSADASNVAFVVDSTGNILFGYDTANDKPIIANSNSLIDQKQLGSEILSADAIRNLKKSEVNEIAAFVVDTAGNILFGYDLLNDKPIIANLDVSAQAEMKKKAFEKKLLVKAINHMLFYGQSLTLGATATTILSTTQPYNNKTFNTGPRMDSTASSVIPLVEQFNNPSNDGQTNRGETPCSGAANYATKLSREQNSQDHVIFASAAGHGGYSISELEKGTTWYNTFLLNQVTKAVELNVSDLKTQVVNWAQGEADITDGTSYATYLAKLNQLQIDMNADIKAITGQTDDIPFITYQCSYGTASSKDIALAQLELVQNNPMFFIASPTYRFSYGSDNTHLTNVGYKLMGAYFGRAYKQLVIDNQVPDFINPKNAKIVGNTIEVTFNVPALPLQFDTSNLAATTNYGFKVVDLTDTQVAISSISIDNNKVVITLATTPSGDLKIRYALDYLGSGLNILNGASGNLRDSTADSVVINSTTHTLFHVCPHFELTAFLVKGI